MKKILLLFIVLATTLTAKAENYILYTSGNGRVVEPKNSGVEIFGAEIVSNTYEDGQGKIVFDGEVTKIGQKAFDDCYLTSIVIPNSVTEIGTAAFYECRWLSSVIIPNSVREIGSNAFNMCERLVNINIPSSVTSIGEQAFVFCGLTSVVLPEGLTSLSRSCFSNCSKLKSVVLPSTLKEIGFWVFKNCTALESINLPEGLMEIQDAPFMNCSSLKEITIPSTVTKFGNGVFQGCTGLTIVTVPASVQEMGGGVFSDCNLETLNVSAPFKVDGDFLIDNRDKSLVCRFRFSPTGRHILPEYITSIKDYAFNNPRVGLRVSGVVIPAGVTKIGKDAFGCCKLSFVVNYSQVDFASHAYEFGILYELLDVRPKYLTDVTREGDFFFTDSEKTQLACYMGEDIQFEIPSTTTSIGDYAFTQVSGMKEVVVPNSVTRLGEYSFSKCPDLASITLGTGMTSIGESPFSGSGLKGIVSQNPIPPTANASICISNTINVSVPAESIEAYKAAEGWNQFQHFRPIGSYILDEFMADGIKYLVTSDSPREVEVIALNETSQDSQSNSVTVNYSGEITIPATISYRGYDFTVTSIGDGAFASCWELKSVSLPNTIVRLGANAFNDCGVEKLVSHSTTPPTAGEGCFDNAPIDYCILQVPAEAVDAYKSAEGWSEFVRIKAIGSMLFDEFIAGDIKYIIMNETTCEVAVTEYYEIDPVTDDCTNLYVGEITIPEIVAYKNVDWTVTAIADYAFCWCGEEMTKIVLPSTVTSIGDWAFSGCSGLNNIVSLSKNVPNLIGSVFDGVNKENCILQVPAESVEAYKAAPEWQDFQNIVGLTDEEVLALGIQSTPAATSKSGQVFNLSGQKVGYGAKGIVIKDGRKMVRK